MCKRMNLKRIIKNNLKVFSEGNMYYYPQIPDPVKVKIMKYFDSDLNPDYVVAFYDDSIFKSSRAGTVFTLTGFYFRCLLENDVCYFNYKDITSMRVIPYNGEDGGEIDELATLEIRLANGRGYEMSGGTYSKEGMKTVLQKLKDEVSQWNDIVSTRASGIYKKSVNPFEKWGQERLEGIRKGYELASAEYEEKLCRQADEFLKQIRDYRKEIEAYEKLLDEYESYIYNLEAKQNNKNSQKIKMMKNQYNELRHLKY